MACYGKTGLISACVKPITLTATMESHKLHNTAIFLYLTYFILYQPIFILHFTSISIYVRRFIVFHVNLRTPLTFPT